MFPNMLQIDQVDPQANKMDALGIFKECQFSCIVKVWVLDFIISAYCFQKVGIQGSRKSLLEETVCGDLILIFCLFIDFQVPTTQFLI